MPKVTLRNGLSAVYLPRKNQTLALQILVRVGSNNETKKQAGYSHFLEHMLFEGTKKRKDSRVIANEIESIGGYFNAYTTNERTCFYIKVLNRHTEKAVDVLSDMIQHSRFDPQKLAKEKKVVVKEIDMVNDDPRNYQWTLFHQHLFQKHPSRNPVYGNRKSILTMKRKDIVAYYKRYYNPHNIVAVISGNVSNWKELLEKNFTFGGGAAQRIKKVIEPPLHANKRATLKKEVISSYMVFGYKTVPRIHPDSYALDIVNGILGRGQSGWMFDAIRGKNGLSYEVATANVLEQQFGFFAVHVSADKEKLPQVTRIIQEQFQRLATVTEKDVAEAKEYVEGNFLLTNEDNQKLADTVCYAESVGDSHFVDKYIQRIKKVTKNDILRVYQKYFTQPHCQTVLEGK